MSKQAEAAAAALNATTFLCGDEAGNHAKRVRIIDQAFKEHERAVAELVAQSKIAATKLMRAYLDASDLTKAIEAVEGT